jgi:hypothetical protein
MKPSAMHEVKKQARELKKGDFVHYFNGDLLKSDDSHPKSYPLSGEIQQIHWKGHIGISFKTVNGWTREFNRQKRFTVEVEDPENRFDTLPTNPVKTPETVQGLSIE